MIYVILKHDNYFSLKYVMLNKSVSAPLGSILPVRSFSARDSSSDLLCETDRFCPPRTLREPEMLHLPRYLLVNIKGGKRYFSCKRSTSILFNTITTGYVINISIKHKVKVSSVNILGQTYQSLHQPLLPITHKRKRKS